MTLRWIDGDLDAIPLVRTMFLEYQAELGIDLCFQSFEEELAGLPGKYAPPRGGLLVAESGADFAACAALRALEDEAAEIKRLYVRPPYRRQGLARSLSEALISRARQMGYARIRLDTLRRLQGALALYESLGFREIAPYNFNPEPDIVYLELNLRL